MNSFIANVSSKFCCKCAQKYLGYVQQKSQSVSFVHKQNKQKKNDALS